MGCKISSIGSKSTAQVQRSTKRLTETLAFLAGVELKKKKLLLEKIELTPLF